MPWRFVLGSGCQHLRQRDMGLHVVCRNDACSELTTTSMLDSHCFFWTDHAFDAAGVSASSVKRDPLSIVNYSTLASCWPKNEILRCCRRLRALCVQCRIEPILGMLPSRQVNILRSFLWVPPIHGGEAFWSPEIALHMACRAWCHDDSRLAASLLACWACGVRVEPSPPLRSRATP